MLKFLEIHRHHHLDVCFYSGDELDVHMAGALHVHHHFDACFFREGSTARSQRIRLVDTGFDNELRSIPELQDLTTPSLPASPQGYANAFLEGGRVTLARQATPGEPAGLPTPRKGRWVYVVPKVFPKMTTDAAILGMWINGPPVAAPAPIIPHGRLLPPPGWAYARTLDEPLVLARLATMEEVVGRIHPPRGWTYLVMYLGARSIVDLGKWLDGMPALL
ncbi:hypothetical protein IWZ00DRAFT_138000 [Phyllosticta capitalensis]